MICIIMRDCSELDINKLTFLRTGKIERIVVITS